MRLLPILAAAAIVTATASAGLATTKVDLDAPLKALFHGKPAAIEAVVATVPPPGHLKPFEGLPLPWPFPWKAPEKPAAAK